MRCGYYHKILSFLTFCPTLYPYNNFACPIVLPLWHFFVFYHYLRENYKKKT